MNKIIITMLFLLIFSTAMAASDEQTENSQSKSISQRVEDDCSSFLSAAKSTSKTIYERSKAADEALHCINKSRGDLISKGSKAEERASTREVLQPLIDEATEIKQQTDSETSFMGLNWGLGFGYSFGHDDAIDDAEIVNDIVRVKSQKKEQPRALLEFHRFFWCNDDYKNGASGCGPFVAVVATQDKILSGVGMGMMYGLKAKDADTEGFSIGLGVILDGKVKDLADGFKKNQAPPTGETQVRFEEKSRWSGLLFVTRTF